MLMLQTSLAMANPAAAITLTASVFGTNPSGSVTFCANGNRLATEALVNLNASLGDILCQYRQLFCHRRRPEGDGDNTGQHVPCSRHHNNARDHDHNPAGNAERGQS